MIPPATTSGWLIALRLWLFVSLVDLFQASGQSTSGHAGLWIGLAVLGVGALVTSFRGAFGASAGVASAFWALDVLASVLIPRRGVNFLPLTVTALVGLLGMAILVASRIRARRRRPEVPERIR